MRFVSLLFLLTACGYHFSDSERPTISVPYVPGDYEGQLTNELAKQIAASGAYRYVQNGGEKTLKVAIVSDVNEKIGFRYDRNEFTGKLKHNLMPTENRRALVAEVTVIETSTEEVVVGPIRITASSEFDYVDVNSIRDLSFITPSGKRETVLNFSLGQLDSIEGAQDDAVFPIYRQLAQKIVAGLVNTN